MQLHETRPQVLVRHINMMMQHSATTFRAYATAVRDVYEHRTPAAQRSIAFHATRDPYADERLNAQIVKRAIDDAGKLPCALEEALVLALPEPFRSECLRDLAARYGTLAAPIPAEAHGQALANAATLMRETGEALADLSQCLDADDRLLPGTQRAVVQRALGNLADVQAAVTTLVARLGGVEALWNRSVTPIKTGGAA